MFLGTATSFEPTSTPRITEYGYWWNHYLDRKFEVFGKNLSYCYSVHHKYQRLHRGKNQNLSDEKPPKHSRVYRSASAHQQCN